MWAEFENDLQAGYRYAFSLCHRELDAEDLVQEAALKLHRLYGAAGNRRLLFTAIRNLFRDQMRKQNLVAFESMDAHADRLVSTEDSRSIPTEDLNDALARLRPSEREMLYLHFVEGYTAQEVSDLVGSPRGTVLSLIHRGVKKLRVSMGRDESPVDHS